MKKILVAYDGSAGADLAIKDMLRGGFPERAEARVLTLADVWLPPATPETGDPPDARYTAVRQKANDLLHEAQQIAVEGARQVHQKFPGWTVTNSARADSPAWGVVAEARRWGADLIIIGSHGRTPLEKLFLGSVSFKVAAEAFCSVRIVRPHRDQARRAMQIMVGIDASMESQLAVEEVLNRNWPRGTEIQLVAVVDQKLKSRLLTKKQNPETSNIIDRVEDWIAPIIEDYRARFASRDLTAHAHIFEGDPKSTLLRHAEKWDVETIFLGARGLDHGNRLYLGTVASAVCTRAHCSVEIVRGASES
jgi:nucleotide-binding universal stress UspA family protein